jgi:hypothetical protein
MGTSNAERQAAFRARRDARLRELEAENAQLRKQLAELASRRRGGKKRAKRKQ